LRNGPIYVALALWLNGPPCKWSGVEWTVIALTMGMVIVMAAVDGRNESVAPTPSLPARYVGW